MSGPTPKLEVALRVTQVPQDIWGFELNQFQVDMKNLAADDLRTLQRPRNGWAPWISTTPMAGTSSISPPIV